MLFLHWICVQELFLCLQHCLGGSRNAFAGLNTAQVFGFFYLRVPLLLLLQWTEGAPDMRSIANTGCCKHICPAIPDKRSIIFSKSMEMVWFLLRAERCQKCSACLWTCTRHPQGCTQNSWGARGQHSGVHNTVLSSHRQMEFVAVTSTWCLSCTYFVLKTALLLMEFPFKRDRSIIV